MMLKFLPGLLLCFTLCFGLPLSVAKTPDLGEVALNTLDQATQTKWANGVRQALHRQVDLNRNPIVNDYVQTLLMRVLSQTDANIPVSIYVVNRDDINAFATFGNIIAIHSGLIQQMQSEDELVGVIAHEVAHLRLMHLQRRFHQMNQEQLYRSLSLMAAVWIGQSHATLGVATALSGISTQLESQLRHSRQHEVEADIQAVKWLQQAGYNPQAMQRFFYRLHRLNNEAGAKSYLQTHPLSLERIRQMDPYVVGDHSQAQPKTQALALVQAVMRHETPLPPVDVTPGSTAYLYRQLLQAPTLPALQALKQLYPEHIALSLALATQHQNPQEKAYMLWRATRQFAQPELLFTQLVQHYGDALSREASWAMMNHQWLKGHAKRACALYKADGVSQPSKTLAVSPAYILPALTHYCDSLH